MTAWLFGVALVATLLIVATRVREGRDFLALALHASPPWLALGVALQVMTYVVDARSWQRMLHRAGLPQPLHGFLSLGLAKLFVDQAVPSGGISGTLVVVRGLERRGVVRTKSMAIVVVDIYAFYAAYVVALLAAFGVLAASGQLELAVLVTASAFLVLAISVVGLLTVLTSRLRRLVPPWLARFRLVAPLYDAVAGADGTLVRRFDLFATSFGHQAVLFGLDALTLWAMVRAVGVHAPPSVVFASFMVSSLTRPLGILPGGIGTFEAASVATLHMVGVSLAAAVASTLLFRGLSFWLPLLPGMIMARRESR